MEIERRVARLHALMAEKVLDGVLVTKRRVSIILAVFAVTPRHSL